MRPSLLLSALCACCLLACGDELASGGAPPPSDGTPVSGSTELEFRPSTLELRVDVPAEVRLFSRSGEVWTDVTDAPDVRWELAGAALRFTAPQIIALAPGDGSLTARRGILAATLPIHVGPTRTAVGLELVPSPIGVLVGAPRPFTVELVYDDGVRRDVTADPGTTLVASGDVRLEGLALVADRAGNGLLRATHQGFSATAEVRIFPQSALSGLTVTPAAADLLKGETLKLHVVGLLPAGMTADLTAEATGTTYMSDGEAAVPVADGVVSARQEGVATIDVANAGLHAAAVVTVALTPAEQLIGLSVEPDRLSGASGEWIYLAIIGHFADGSIRNLNEDPALEMTSSAEDIAILLYPWVVALVDPGTTTITAQLGGVSASVPVQVREPIVVGSQVTPTWLELAVGELGAFVVTQNLENGESRDVSCETSWRMRDPGVASVDGCGIVTALSLGTTLVFYRRPESGTEESLVVRVR